MQVQRSRLRNKLRFACALVAAGTLAAPGAFARSHDYNGYSGYHRGYDSHGWHGGSWSQRGWHGHGGNTVGALIAGALVGGVIVNAIDHANDYNSRTTYYAPPPPPPGYYQDGYYGGNDGAYDGDGYAAGTYYGNGYAPTYNAPVYDGDDGN